jgi:hypothetical protein
MRGAEQTLWIQARHYFIASRTPLRRIDQILEFFRIYFPVVDLVGPLIMLNELPPRRKH